MASAKQKAAARKNIKKAQAARRAKLRGKRGKARRGKLSKKELNAIRMRNLAKGRRRRASSKKIVRGKIGAKRRKGRVLGVLDRRPGMLYYVTKNGSIVETSCRNGGCRKSKSKVKLKSGRVTGRRSRVRMAA